MSSVSSRPSSSLSQQSSCTGDEQREQQVSQQHELERFEGASLRDSLSRRRCRDPRASPHFAINPLLHLEPARSSANSQSDCKGDEQQAGNLVANARTDNAIEDATGNRGSRNDAESNLKVICEKQEGNRVLTESLETGADFRQLVSADWNRLWDGDRDRDPPVEEEPIVPQYDDSREELSCDIDGRDHDSGMCSIGSRDSEMSERDRWRKLYQVENNDNGRDEQISSIGGRRFWITGKYHTYGGIRIQPNKAEDLDDFEDELISPENCSADHDTEFAKLKFQTFGGIKRSRKIDKRKIPSYRRIRIRPALSEGISFNTEKNRDQVGTETSANFELYSNLDYAGSFDRLTSSNCSTSFEHSTSSTFEESDWQDEKNDVTSDRVSARYAQIAHGKNRTPRTSPKVKHRNLIRKSNKNSSSLWSLPTEDDEWQDEIDCASDEIIMNKFLKDVSKRRKAYAFSDDNIATRERENIPDKSREILEKNSNGGKPRGLRKSMKNNENNLKSSKESQMQEWKSDNNRCKKLRNVRSLSDVTIW